MNTSAKALKMLEKYVLCDHCLGRQFAMLGHGMENNERGKVIKTILALEAHRLAISKKKEGIRILELIATNGFSEMAKIIKYRLKKPMAKNRICKSCFLCEGAFEIDDALVAQSLKKLKDYEYSNFLVGIKLPILAEEREDEFKAEYEVRYGESLRKEFGRIIGKKIAEQNGKIVEYRKPEVVVHINPLMKEIRLQVNPLYIAGRYRKLVRGIPQSRWLCSRCRGKGCEKCNWTGKMYSESIEEIVERPFLDATQGIEASFHASGREDIDARMLGNGRPFVIEIKKPKKRFLDLPKLEDAANAYAKGKVSVSDLKFADKSDIRNLKKLESAQKEYLVVMKFENEITPEDLLLLDEKLTNALIRQRTPVRVMHRRADLTREKHIYEVKVKKLSPKKAEVEIHCQGGLYVKELVTGDDGRTKPSISAILQNKAEPIQLDVLNVITND